MMKVKELFYMKLLKKDVGTYYSYNNDLIDIFFRLFSPAEAIEFFESVVLKDFAESNLPLLEYVSYLFISIVYIN